MEYGKPAKLQDGRYFLKITNRDGSRVLKQINNAEVQEEPSYFRVSDYLTDYDDQIISQADVCSEQWFGKKIDTDSLKKAYDSSVSAGILEAPVVRKSTGEVVTKIFDCERQEVAVDVLVPGTRCDIIIELSGLWFLKKSFGPVWRLVQARLKKPSTFPQKYLFLDDDSADDDNEYRCV